MEFTLFNRLDHAIAACGSNPPDAVLLDLNLPDSQGLDTFKRFSECCPQLPVIVLTVTDLVETATEAVRLGAEDYLVKGEFTGQLLVRAIRYAIERKANAIRLLQANELLEERVQERTEELVETNESLLREIEERVRTEDALRVSEEKFRTYFEHAGEGIFIIDSETTILAANPWRSIFWGTRTRRG